MVWSGAVSIPPEVSVGTRLWFAWVCFFKVLFDGMFASKVWAAHTGQLALPAPPDEPKLPPKPPTPVSAEPRAPSTDSALQLMALFQREGRFVDFLEEDVTTFGDAEIGAAARVVHQGCRKALHDHAKVKSVRDEEEGVKITVAQGTPPSEVKLIGNVAGEAPFKGRLVHKGWRLEGFTLPTAIDGHDLSVIAPAEVEL